MIPNKLPDIIADLYSRIGEVERRARNRKRTGTIEEGPDDQGRYRVKISETDGKPFLTGWIKPKTLGAGGIKIDAVHTKGEQVDVVSENGDMTDAVIDLSTYSEANARENTGNAAFHIKTGGSTLEVTGEGVKLIAGTIDFEGKFNVKGDVTIEGATAITGSSLTHNGKNVGSDHKHIGVTAGPDQTGEPA